MNNRQELLSQHLADAKDEKPLQVYFEKYPEVFVNTFDNVQQGHLVSQFRMGGGIYIPDFVMAHGFSGGWDITLIELESPCVPLFSKDGNQGRHLRSADRQVNEWKHFVDLNKLSFLRDLSYDIRDRDLNYTIPGRGKEPTDSVGCKLYDPSCMIIWNYAIVIGQSSRMTQGDVFRKARTNRDSYEIITYNRFLESAKQCDQQHWIYENE